MLTMIKKEIIEALKGKSVKELLELLQYGQGENKNDPDYLNAVINELNSRELSESELIELKRLTGYSFDESDQNESENFDTSYPIGIVNELSNEEIISINKSSENREREPGRYTALKSIVGVISIFANIVLLIGAIVLFYLATQSQALPGCIALVVSIVIALPLLAFSNLIYVFIDIEYNTRKTREALKKKS